LRGERTYNVRIFFGVGMKKNSNKKRMLLFFLSVACGGAASYFVGITVFGADSYSFHFDPLLSCKMQDALKDVAGQSWGSLSFLGQALKQTCPALESVVIERLANKTISIKALCKSPYVKLSNGMVVLKPGLVVGSECFADAALAAIPVITIKGISSRLGTESHFPIVPMERSEWRDRTQRGDVSSESLSQEFKQWLINLDPTIVHNYQITWVDDYEIYVTDKNNTQPTLVCCVNTQVDEKIMGLCQCIMKEKSINAQGTARQTFYSADIRFEKQIIICSQKGGACYG
jgi:hypothetical protein